MHHAGIDLHKKYSYITVVDDDNQIILQDKFKNDKMVLQNALLQLNNPIRAVVEATFNSYWLVNVLKDVNINSVVTHPTKLKAIASSKIKTDKIDSTILAKLLRHNMLPLSYIPSKQEQILKDIVRLRLDLVNQRSRLKTKLKFILLRNCIFELPYRDTFCQRGQKWLLSLDLLRHEKESIQNLLNLINEFSVQIGKFDKDIKNQVDKNYHAKLLMTVPGIGPIVALTLVAEIGNVHRFKSSGALCSYAGMIPSTYSSGGKTTHGGTTKQGSKFIRYALSEAVLHTIRKNEHLKEFYDRKSKEKGESKAKVACMKKLLTYVYNILKYDLKYEQLAIASRPLQDSL